MIINISGQDNYSTVLSQYIFFIGHIHGRSFFWTGAFFSKFNLISQDARESLSTSNEYQCLFSNESDKTIGIPTGIPGITFLVAWLCPRYQYYFLLELIFLNSSILIKHAVYFYSLMRPGDKTRSMFWTIIHVVFLFQKI